MSQCGYRIKKIYIWLVVLPTNISEVSKWTVLDASQYKNHNTMWY